MCEKSRCSDLWLLGRLFLERFNLHIAACTIFSAQRHRVQEKDEKTRVLVINTTTISSSSRSLCLCADKEFNAALVGKKCSKCRQCAYSTTTWLESLPTCSNSISTTSPCFKNTGGFRAKPTPLGVPVKINVPGKSVWPLLISAISVATEK